MYRKIQLIAAFLFTAPLLGCSSSPPSPVKHEWTYVGETVSMQIETGFVYSHAVIFTTQGSVLSYKEIPNPFIKGVPVYVRDDSQFARIGDKAYFLNP